MQLVGVSCPSTTHCVAVGAVSTAPGLPPAGVTIATTNGGASWVGEPVPPGVGSFVGVSCPSTTECVAAGDTETEFGTPAGIVVATTDDGATWAPENLPSDVAGLGALSCAAPGYCQAVGATAQDVVILGEAPSG
jgi:hypothetical protein